MINGIQQAANIARLLGEPIRLAILQALVRTEANVSELLEATQTTQSNLSNHIKLLRENGLLEGVRQGRQIIYRIRTPAIAELVEALFMSVDNFDEGPPPVGALAQARTCYDHLAGKLGVAILAGLVRLEALTAPSTEWSNLELGRNAQEIFTRLGIDLGAEIQESTRRRFAYACADWSEHGHSHIGGLIGAILCARFLTAGWIKRDRATRAIKLTRSGAIALQWLLETQIPS